MGHEKGEKFMSYLNSVTIIGFVGADPEQRQARNNNGSKFTVLSVATQRSWKNTDDEWASKTEWHRVCVFRPRLAEYVATTIKKGAHVLVQGSLVSTTYERNGEWKKSSGPLRIRTSRARRSKMSVRKFLISATAPSLRHVKVHASVRRMILRAVDGLHHQ